MGRIAAEHGRACGVFMQNPAGRVAACNTAAVPRRVCGVVAAAWLLGISGATMPASHAFAPPNTHKEDPRAEVLRGSLVVEPGATCLATEPLVEHILSWLGEDRIPSDISIKVVGSASDPRAVVVEMRSAVAKVDRPFPRAPANCSDLHAVIGLAIAMAIDATFARELIDEVAPQQPVVPPPSPPASTDQVDNEMPPRLLAPPPAVDLPVRAPAKFRASIAARAGVWVYVLPIIAGGGQLHAEFAWHPWFELRAGVLGGRASTRTVGERPLAYGLLAGRADACFGPEAGLGRPRPRFCVGAAAGGLRVVAPELSAGQWGLWLAGALGIELRVVATPRFRLDAVFESLVTARASQLGFRNRNKDGSLPEFVSFPRVGVMLGVGGAFTVR